MGIDGSPLPSLLAPNTTTVILDEEMQCEEDNFNSFSQTPSMQEEVLMVELAQTEPESESLWLIS